VNGNAPGIFFFFSFVLFLLATLVAGGVITASLPWLIPAGATAAVLAFLWGGWGSNFWNRTP
jgi:hypothetical protein